MQNYVYDYLEELAPQIKERLRKSDVYARFLFARKQLRTMADEAWDTTGTFNKASILEKKKDVAALGEAVLEEVKSIAAMLSVDDEDARESRPDDAAP